MRVELWGDSLSAQAAPYIRFALQATGKVTAQVHTFGGTALCDWFSDMRTETDPANPSGFHPDIAIIQFSGDAFTPCMKDQQGQPYSGQANVTKYRADSAVAIALLTRANVEVYFASTPISRADAALGYVGNTPLGVMFSTLPARFPAAGRVHFIDAAAAVEWHGRFSFTLPCQAGETCTGRWPDGTKTVVVRQSDGGHFCPVTETVAPDGSRSCPVPMPGARRFAAATAAPILRDFGLN